MMKWLVIFLLAFPFNTNAQSNKALEGTWLMKSGWFSCPGEKKRAMPSHYRSFIFRKDGTYSETTWQENIIDTTSVSDTVIMNGKYRIEGANTIHFFETVHRTSTEYWPEHRLNFSFKQNELYLSDKIHTLDGCPNTIIYTRIK